MPNNWEAMLYGLGPRKWIYPLGTICTTPEECLEPPNSEPSQIISSERSVPKLPCGRLYKCSVSSYIGVAFRLRSRECVPCGLRAYSMRELTCVNLCIGDLILTSTPENAMVKNGISMLVVSTVDNKTVDTPNQMSGLASNLNTHSELPTFA